MIVARASLTCRCTVEDPSTYAGPWTTSIPLVQFDGPIYEHACHEGNYGMENPRRGARVQKQDVARSK